MDYAKAAADVLKCIGGKENVISAAHCATRLRLVIADNKKVDKAALEDVTGVQGVFEAQGQLQNMSHSRMTDIAGRAESCDMSAHQSRKVYDNVGDGKPYGHPSPADYAGNG